MVGCSERGSGVIFVLFTFPDLLLRCSHALTEFTPTYPTKIWEGRKSRRRLDEFFSEECKRAPWSCTVNLETTSRLEHTSGNALLRNAQQIDMSKGL